MSWSTPPGWARRFAAFFGDRFTPATTQQAAGAAVRMHYSDEGRDFGAALETAGGIVRALPQLADPFWVLAGDVFAPDFVFSMAALNDFRASGQLAQIWLVPNPPHNPGGDFGLTDEGLASNDGDLPPDLQHHRPVPPRLFCAALLRHRGRQPARHQGTAGADAANGDGSAAGQRPAIHWPLGGRRYAAAAGPTQPGSRFLSIQP